MRLSELTEGLEDIRLEGRGAREIMGISYDSRQVRPGDLFVAIEGFRTDGHLYLEEAGEKGAVAVVVERGRELPSGLAEKTEVARTSNTRKALALLSDRLRGHPSGRLKLVGVTGTNGKTTTTHLVEAAMDRVGITSGLVGTVVYRIAGKELPVERTTPESADLQELLASMVDAGCEVASMEVSSHALALDRVTGCEFAVGVFTNLSQDHLDFHADMEDYFYSKTRLFLPPEEGGLGVEVSAVNVDDPYGRRLVDMVPGKVLTYGREEGVGLRGELLQAGLKRSRVAVTYEGRRMEGETALTGSFNLYNILAAMGASLLLEVEAEKALAGILSYPGVSGRFEAVDEGQDFAVLVDYAHTPDSLRRVLEAAREIAPGRVLALFGCGGDRDRGKRPIMGEIGVRLSDLAFITSDNPRSEEPLDIIAMIEEGARPASSGTDYEIIPDRREAIEAAIGEAEAGDVVVIAGKGHERGQIFADKVLPFDDRQEARSALRRRMGKP
jgi:UDP-N-acetylmuramoyl-L-alanyl-D-glutamate--2,6-diaminopimelate ligase